MNTWEYLHIHIKRGSTFQPLFSSSFDTVMECVGSFGGGKLLTKIGGNKSCKGVSIMMKT